MGGQIGGSDFGPSRSFTPKSGKLVAKTEIPGGPSIRILKSHLSYITQTCLFTRAKHIYIHGQNTSICTSVHVQNASTHTGKTHLRNRDSYFSHLRRLLYLTKDKYNPAPTLLASEMSTGASIPTVSKLDAAQQDRPTAHDEDGNLSEKRVKERFMALPEDTKQLLKKLGTEFGRRHIGSVSDILEWGAYLSKTLKTPDLVDLFTKWMFFRRP